MPGDGDADIGRNAHAVDLLDRVGGDQIVAQRVHSRASGHIDGRPPDCDDCAVRLGIRTISARKLVAGAIFLLLLTQEDKGIK